MLKEGIKYQQKTEYSFINSIN